MKYALLCSSPPSEYRDIDGESLLFELNKLILIDTIILLKMIIYI